MQVIKEYPFPPEEYNYPSPTIREALSIIDKSIWDQLNIPWSNIDIRYCSTLNNLGPYCASLFLYMEIQHHVEKILVDNKLQLMAITSDDMDIDFNMNTVPSKPVKTIPKDIFDIFDILRDFEAFFPGDFLSSASITQADWYTPKVHKLIEILKEYHTPTFQCIIFVEQRQDALCLARLLRSIPNLMEYVRCGYLMGNGTNNEGVSKMADRLYDDPIKSFRERQINICISVSFTSYCDC
jgi:endoribonuclease Dicer